MANRPQIRICVSSTRLLSGTKNSTIQSSQKAYSHPPQRDWWAK